MSERWLTCRAEVKVLVKGIPGLQEVRAQQGGLVSQQRCFGVARRQRLHLFSCLVQCSPWHLPYLHQQILSRDA